MPSFVGFDDYVPIFSGGKQTDRQGNVHDGNELIDKAVQLFDPEYHEAPITVGHPKDNSPAFGWVEEIRKVTQKLKDGSKVKILMAKFKDVVPEFVSAVKQGLYKKRSASFYPDGRLRHVGFLGGMPPAVKGLADLKFEEFDEPPIIFGEMEPIEVIEIHNKIYDFWEAAKSLLIKTFGVDEVEKALESSGAELKPAGNPLFSEGGNMPDLKYSEEQLQTQLEAERKRLVAEFAEKEKTAQSTASIQKQIDEAAVKGRQEAEAEFAEQRRKDAEQLRKASIKEFITQGIKTGAILPAWEKLGLAQFMENLEAEEVIDFAEGKTETLQQWFKRFLDELPKTVNFAEFATRDKDAGASGNVAAQLDNLTAKKMKDNPKIDYVSAFAEVQLENPDLVTQYEQEIYS